MEQRCLKSNVFVNDTIFSDSIEQAIDIDFTLPDYCPDISKIFKCQASPRISSKIISGKNITIDGNIAINLLYAERGGRICSYEYNYPFSKNLEMSSEAVGANLCCRIRTEYINCRAVTGRKVDIHGAAGIFVKVFKRRTTEIISDYDDCNIELRRDIAPATVPMGYAEKYLTVEEDIRIGEGQPVIRNILRSDANSCIKETKVVSGKAVVKGELTVALLYCPENSSEPQSVKTVIPFSQIIEVEGINESCSCDCKSEIANFDIKPRISSSGECKSFSLKAKILLTCEGYCGNEIAVVLDAFSRKFKADIVRNKVCFERIVHNISESYSCKKSITLDEEISSVVDLWCSVHNITTKFEAHSMIICGTLVAGMIICDTSGNSLYCEKPIEFEYKYPLENELTQPHCEPQLEILSCGYTITGASNVEIRVEISINAAVYEKKEISLISDVSVDETQLNKSGRKGAMTIYFPSNNECVWDIARIYNASVEEIMRINDLESDILIGGRMILVPVM